MLFGPKERNIRHLYLGWMAGRKEIMMIKVLVLDTETTGLDDTAEILQISAMGWKQLINMSVSFIRHLGLELKE